MPACARTFCSRSSPSVGIDRVRTEPLLESLHHVGPGHEVAERREVVDRVQTETLEEQSRRAVHQREARTRITRHLLDEAALLQGAHNTVDVDASDGGHLRPA